MKLHAVRYVFNKVTLLILGATLMLMGSAYALTQLQKSKADVLPNDQTVLVRLKLPDQGLSGLELTQAISTARLEFSQATASLGAETIRNYDNFPVVAMKVNADSRAAIEASNLVESIQDNQWRKAQLAEALPKINPDPVYAAGLDGTGYAVAVLDSGVEATHSFFGGRVIYEACFSDTSVPDGVTSACPGAVNTLVDVAGAASPQACLDAGIDPLSCGHGTHVSGIVAGSGGPAGIHGVAENADIIAMNVFVNIDNVLICPIGENPCMLTADFLYLSALDQVLTLANDPGFTTPIAAVNMSLGGGQYFDSATCDSDNSVVKAAVDDLKTAGIATIAASGNEAYDDSMGSPACISSVVSVGSTNDSDLSLWSSGACSPLGAEDEITCFTNSEAGMLDLLAPGAIITSSLTGDTYGDEAGTSQASPVVAGAWALLKQAKPSATVDEILAALSSTGTPITRASSGEAFPLIDVDAAYDVLVVPAISVDYGTGPVILGEGGSGWNLDVSLAKAPTAQVDLTLNLDNAEVALDDSSICFDLTATVSCNAWNDPITVIATADDDVDQEPNTTTVFSIDAASTDLDYDPLAYGPLNITVIDNDTPGVTVAESSGTEVTEGGATDTFSYVLNSLPTAQVDIVLTPADSQVSLDDTTICFAPVAAGDCVQWDTPIVITATATNDTAIEADSTTTVTAAATSSDADYEGITIAPVNITAVDDDTPSGCTPSEDGDCDGVSDSTEGTGDYNGDGTADSSQTNVATIPSSIASKPVTLVVSGGTGCSTPRISDFDSLSEDAYGASTAADFPLGLNSFTIADCASGTTVSVKVIFDTEYPGADKFYKVINNSGTVTVTEITSFVTFAVETINAKKVTTASYQITDGGALDQDGLANGTIVDPSGVGVSQGAGISSLTDTGPNNFLNTLVGTIIMSIGLYVGVQSVRRSNRKLVYEATDHRDQNTGGVPMLNIEPLFQRKQAEGSYTKRSPMFTRRSLSWNSDRSSESRYKDPAKDPMLR